MFITRVDLNSQLYHVEFKRLVQISAPIAFSASQTAHSLWVEQVLMAPEHPTAFWQAIQDGNAFYKKQEIYLIDGKIPELDNYVIAGCRCGGPIGVDCL